MPTITDLTGTKWLINDTFSTMPSGLPMDGEQGYNDILYINFISNSNIYSYIEWGDGDMIVYEYNGVLLYNTQNSQTIVWGGSWKNQVYRTIEITGGTDATNSTLINWLLANATQIEPEVTPTPSSFSTLKYSSSTKTLTINGINYVLDSSASGNSAIGTSFSNISLTEEGVLTIDGVSINLPLYSEAPENSILTDDGTYLVDVNGDYITTTEISGYTAEFEGSSGLGEYIYVQINDDPTWYYAQLKDTAGFVVEKTNIPNVYQALIDATIAIDNVTKIRIGVQGEESDFTGPKYMRDRSAGDFSNLVFYRTGGSAPYKATDEITMTQNSKIFFKGDE